jgi:ABC-type uncharacterized transport system permease subunit
MQNLDIWLLLAGTAAYMAALVTTLFRLARRREPLHGTNLILILAGWLIQTAGLWIIGLTAKQCPIRNPFEVLQFVSWSIIILWLFTGQVFRLSLFGAGCATLAALISFISFLMPGMDGAVTPGSHLAGNPRIDAHAALALFGYGIFGLLAVISVLYLLQNFSLKKKRSPAIFRFLPSLVEMDTVMLRLLIMACTVYTVSVGIGALYWIENFNDLALPKLVLTVALWIAYWIVLVLRATNKLFGTRLAWTCILLLVAALLILWPVEASRQHKSAAPVALISQTDFFPHVV